MTINAFPEGSRLIPAPPVVKGCTLGLSLVSAFSWSFCCVLGVLQSPEPVGVRAWRRWKGAGFRVFTGRGTICSLSSAGEASRERGWAGGTAL